MRRRQFLGALGGAAVWPVVVSAQSGERMRSVGVLIALLTDDSARADEVIE